LVSNFGKKSHFWSKIAILVKNRNFGQKSKFWSKIVILVKNYNFGQKSKFLSKMVILVKNRNFDHKLQFLSEIRILVKNVGRTSIFLLDNPAGNGTSSFNFFICWSINTVGLNFGGFPFGDVKMNNLSKFRDLENKNLIERNRQNFGFL